MRRCRWKQGEGKNRENKVAPPFKEGDITYGEGISREGNVLTSVFSWTSSKKRCMVLCPRDQRLGRGRENVKKFQGKPELAKVENKIDPNMTRLYSERGSPCCG